MKIHIGIDNGVSGAIAYVTGDIVEAKKLAVNKFGKKTEIDPVWLSDQIEECAKIADKVYIVVEQAQSFSPGKMALCSTHSCCGAIKATIRLLQRNYRNISVEYVDPKTWQKDMFKGIPRNKDDDTKLISIEVARRLYPGLSLLPTQRCKTDDNGMADAVLMATWAKRKNS